MPYIPTGTLGTDVITNALIYQAGVGPSAGARKRLLDSTVDSSFLQHQPPGACSDLHVSRDR